MEDITEIMAIADVSQILHEYFHEGKGDDPIVHFYETFLAEYDPEKRERRGVYYTPEPVVSYIVSSVNHILKQHFDREDGLATSSVRLLDPAAGTLTFIAKAIQLAVEEFTQKYGSGAKEGLIKDHILKNYYAFELMMAPYAVGHLKMSFLLEEYGYQLQKDERFKLYLTNTLEMEELEERELPLMSSLSKESHLAQEVKEETPILVIIGNPPYSGHSANTGEWIQKSLKEGYTKEDGTERQSYYEVDGEPLGERNPKWLQNDYVKFIRFGQWKIDQAGEGVLGFITNHSYLDNPTFRGMRQSLMETFDQIYFLDLHGNSLKREKCPDGSKDENVFDIRQGVAIALFIKNRDLAHKIYHSDLWGLRDEKYEWLLDNSVKTTDWEEINPISNFYLFKPRDEELLEQYKTYPKVTEIFPVNSVGIVTSRDSFVIDFDKESLKRRIRMFRNPDLPDDMIRETFGLRDKRNWTLSEQRKKVMEDKDWKEKITEILYRPFDTRWIFYHEEVIERSRKEVMRHMMQDNLGLLFTRPYSPQYDFSVLVASTIIDQCAAGNKSAGAGISYAAPLYLYLDISKKNLFHATSETPKKQSNINEELVAKLAEIYGVNPTPDDIFHYIYGLLYAPSYRVKYASFLADDFPGVLFTQDYELFKGMSDLGKQLVNLHLLKSKDLTPPIARFQGEGSNKIAKSKRVGRNYKPEEKRVYINKDGQYFEGIEPEVWEYQIGGYQVLDKWLKDRRERELSMEEIKHYCKVVTTLQKTIEIQEKIDEIYPGVEEETEVVGSGLEN